ncbi:MAG: hypothetical protein ACLTZW_00975 [Paratractidigestivibacter faecalis]
MKPRKTLTERVLALLLALATATALVPAPALAEAVDELTAAPQAEAAAEGGLPDAPAADVQQPTPRSRADEAGRRSRAMTPTNSWRPSRPLRLPLQERPMPPQLPLPTR